MVDRSRQDQQETKLRPGAEKQLSRRGFIKATGGTLAATTLAGPTALAIAEEGEAMGQGGITGFFKALFGVCETAKLSPELWSREGDTVRVKADQIPQLAADGGAVYLAGQGLDVPLLVLRRSEGNYLAVSNRCTHMGRKLDPVPGKEVLRCCSVSHSSFDHEGKVTGGPAKGPLTVYPAALEKGQLVVRLKT